MNQRITREVTPLTDSDCFTLFWRVKNHFDFPLHYHDEYELNLILNAKGAKRIVGDHVARIDDVELVLVGSNLYHGWFDDACDNRQITEVTIQFHRKLFGEEFLHKNQLNFIRNMFDKSQQGILFTRETVLALKDRLIDLKDKVGFDSVLELMAILHRLSQSDGIRMLSSVGFDDHHAQSNSRRIVKVFEYLNAHYQEPITLADIAAAANMHEASFSRFVKKSTGKTFIDSLNEIRLGHATRLLIDTSQTIAEIAYGCGFNNISNFNRIFKRKKNCTPKEFRDNFSGARVYI
ncbi:AraC family transcriptional regulator [Parapedobacter pyrenivorans]|uniref:AraC family transcriptional regulator n=1 Tax=Parapedobacter pyrenivorans TaxID=1305674 RepID=A0A917HP04_9SPHI|nr:AraC family transcriptional regulator [Parapedobacter pyrenivorans]GGG84764.1 AraC family transcriptional regulator [Parapedobacter pyrenivorans]